MTLLRSTLAALAVVALAPPAFAKAGDIHPDDKSRIIPDPMDAQSCKQIYTAGRYFPQATKKPADYKPEDCKTPAFWAGTMINADKDRPGFDKLPLCLGMGKTIDHYLTKYPNKCRRLTAVKDGWSQELNQKLIWCAGKGYLGKVIWLSNNEQLSAGRAKSMLAANNLFVTASEACFWHHVMRKPFPYSGKTKREQAATKKQAAKSSSRAAPPKSGSTPRPAPPPR